MIFQFRQKHILDKPFSGGISVYGSLQFFLMPGEGIPDKGNVLLLNKSPKRKTGNLVQILFRPKPHSFIISWNCS